MTTTYDLTFDRVVYDTDVCDADGIYGGRRYATNWTDEDGRQWRVSSVDHHTATETMVFKIVDGEVNYFDVAATKEYMGSKRDHGAFLAEYLQRELHDLYPTPFEIRIRKCPPDLSTFTENNP